MRTLSFFEILAAIAVIALGWHIRGLCFQLIARNRILQFLAILICGVCLIALIGILVRGS